MTRTVTTNGTLGAAPDSSISTTITSTVTLSSGGYSSPLNITNTGAIIPTSAGATGLVVPASMTGASIGNQGTISGAAQSKIGQQGGLGVNLGSGELTNVGVIIGGAGGRGYYPILGGATIGAGAGGTGVNVTSGASLTNVGTIIGGTGGAFEGPGGVGVSLHGGTLITSGIITGGSGGGAGPVAHGPAVEFGAAAAELIVDPGAVFNGAITGFTVGDTIELAGVTVTGSSYVGGVLTLDEAGGGSAALSLRGTFTTASFQVRNVAAGADVTLAAPCFCIHTRILTAAGGVPVEHLLAHDHVLTLSGRRLARIRWLGHRHIDCRRHARPTDIWPICVRARAFGDSLPSSDLLLSPDHAVCVEGVLVPVRHLINDSTIVQEPVDEVTYYHVELATHDVILAEGVPCESYLDTGNRAAFENGEAAAQPDYRATIP